MKDRLLAPRAIALLLTLLAYSTTVAAPVRAAIYPSDRPQADPTEPNQTQTDELTFEEKPVLVAPIVIEVVPIEESEEKTDSPLKKKNPLSFIQQRLQQSLTKERPDPYVIIESARQHTSVPMRKGAFDRDKVSLLPALQLSKAQASAQRQAARIRERLPKLVTSPQSVVKQTVERMSDSARATLLNALRWTERKAHVAAEQVRRS